MLNGSFVYITVNIHLQKWQNIVFYCEYAFSIPYTNLKLFLCVFLNSFFTELLNWNPFQNVKF